MISALLAAHGMLQKGSTEVTIYNQGLGFIKDIRQVSLKKGQQNVVIEDVAQMIDATSVGFKCLSNPGSVSILEQNYQYDLVSPEAILQKSVGKRIRFTRTVGNGKETLEGVLLSSPTAVTNTGQGSEYSYNGLVIKADDGRIILSPQGEIDVLEMPEGLISKPSLLWQVDSAEDQNAKMELSYLTGGLSWNANYVLTIGEKGNGDLQGWVTLNNQSGYSFADATLKLLAGDVNVFSTVGLEFQRNKPYAYGSASRNRRDFKEESLFEYHLYTLDRPATVRNKENKQLNLLEGFNVPFKKVLSFDGYAEASGGPGTQINEPAKVQVKFANNEKSHLGMPMPAGKVRLYQRDSKGSVQFLGEDQIQHTPRDEKINLTVGKSFDIRTSRKRTDYAKVGKNGSRSTYEIEVRNRKNEDVTMCLYEHLPNSWKITAKSDTYTKEDSNTVLFQVKVKAGQVKTVKYTMEAKW